MKTVLQDAVALIFSLLAKLASPAVQSLLERWATRLAGDVPRVGTAWVVRFRYPARAGGGRACLIDARLRQFGRRVSGSGSIEGQPGDPFRYAGFIRRNVLCGTFERQDAQMLAGTGVFILKIAADTRRMTGRCAWYQSRIDAVWSSRYVWLRRG